MRKFWLSKAQPKHAEPSISSLLRDLAANIRVLNRIPFRSPLKDRNLKKKTAALTPAELESAAQNVRFVGHLPAVGQQGGGYDVEGPYSLSEPVHQVLWWWVFFRWTEVLVGCALCSSDACIQTISSGRRWLPRQGSRDLED